MAARSLTPLALATLVAAGCAGTVDAADPDGTALPESVHADPFFGGDPTHGAEFAVDVSFWEGPISEREMDCFWDSGVRHVVVGTQVAEVTRQQLAMAVARGMTVDAYVYLHWSSDAGAQVDQAFADAAGYPIGRMWLDVEEPQGARSATAIEGAIATAVDRCRAHGLACGIYTGWGFWHDAVADTTQFADVPLWYALYDHQRTLGDWAHDRFGGWSAPVGKQFDPGPRCGLAADGDVLRVLTQPTVTVDRTPAPPPTAPPPAPTGLYPDDGATVTIDEVKMMALTIPGATEYQFALEQWNCAAFVTWYTWSAVDPFVKTTPTRNRLYRFRARAADALGWGPWSAPSTFVYGQYTGAHPSSPDLGEPSSTSTPDLASGGAILDGGVTAVDAETAILDGGIADAASSLVPTGLAPDGETLTSASVTLACASVSGASGYQFELWVDSGSGTFQPYVTYTSASPSKTFWPQVRPATYRFAARALVGGAYQAWSAPASFQVH